MIFRSPLQISRFARQTVGLVVLVCVFASTIPLPIGIVVEAFQAGGAFPCQGCGCGCRTAEQCWTTCCCYTPEQRQAWARNNGVKPPSYAVLESAPCKVPTKSNCCQQGSQHAKCVSEEAPSSRWVVPAIAAKCHGKTADLSLLPWAVPASADEANLFVADVVERFAIIDERGTQEDVQPPSPPPRRTFAALA